MLFLSGFVLMKKGRVVGIQYHTPSQVVRFWKWGNKYWRCVLDQNHDGSAQNLSFEKLPPSIQQLFLKGPSDKHIIQHIIQSVTEELDLQKEG